MKNKLIIVAGCSGSGKTTIANEILKTFRKGQAQVICLDRFYWGKCKKVPFNKKTGQYNFDHPSAFDWKWAEKSLKDLLNNKSTFIPKYDYLTSTREKTVQKVKPTKVIILEGTLPLYEERIRNLATLKVFVKTPMDVCFIRRLQRDQKERGRKTEWIVKRWQTAVRPMYEQFIYPTKAMSNVIIPWDGDNKAGLSVLLNSIKHLVK